MFTFKKGLHEFVALLTLFFASPHNIKRRVLTVLRNGHTRAQPAEGPAEPQAGEDEYMSAQDADDVAKFLTMFFGKRLGDEGKEANVLFPAGVWLEQFVEIVGERLQEAAFVQPPPQ